MDNTAAFLIVLTLVVEALGWSIEVKLVKIIGILQEIRDESK